MKLTGRVVVTASERVQQLSAPFLTELTGLKKSLHRRGREIVDLGTYQIAVESKLASAVVESDASLQLEQAFVEYLNSEMGTDLDPDHEILLLPGARATLLLIGAYFVEPGTTCYLPDPGFDAYRKMILLFGGTPKNYSLHQRTDYLPNLEQFHAKDSKNPKLLFINSPHNPTGAVCDHGIYSRLRKIAAEGNILVVVDSSYAVSFAGNYRPPLFSESLKQLRVGLEMISFSTTFCSPELKLTALIGRKGLIEPLRSLAQSMGLTVPKAYRKIAARTLGSSQEMKARIDACRSEITQRTAILTKSFQDAGLEFFPSTGAGFVWVKLKRGRVSLSFARGLLRHKGIVVAPGSAFGEEGEGWVRICVNVEGQKLKEAVDNFVGSFHPLRSRLKRRRK